MVLAAGGGMGRACPPVPGAFIPFLPRLSSCAGLASTLLMLQTPRRGLIMAAVRPHWAAHLPGCTIFGGTRLLRMSLDLTHHQTAHHIILPLLLVCTPCPLALCLALQQGVQCRALAVSGVVGAWVRITHHTHGAYTVQMHTMLPTC